MRRPRGTAARCGALGLLAAIMIGGVVLFGDGTRQDRELPPSADAELAADVPDAAETLEPVMRREQAASGARPLRAADGPGIQGWLAVDGAELPAWLAVRGAGAPRDGRVAVDADGHFAIPEARDGARLLITLPDHLVTSEAPSDDSVIGSRYVHVVAPARVDVLAQTLASALQVRLLLPDDGAPAAGLRVLCRLDGPSARDFTLAADAQGWLAAPLPADGWWSTLRMTPLAHERTLHERLYVRRVDVPASGVYGGLRLRRSAVVTLRFLDPLDRPVPDVTAAEPGMSTTSDADGLLLVRKEDRAEAEWRHQRFVTSQAGWSLSFVAEGAAEVVRMVPSGNWALTLGAPVDDDEHVLRLVPYTLDRHHSNAWSMGGALQRRIEDRQVSWSLDNRLIGRDAGLLYEWCGIPIHLEPIEVAPGADSGRMIRPANFTQYEVLLLRHDGTPAARASVRCRRFTEHADADGWLRFRLPDAIGLQSLRFSDGGGSPSIDFLFGDCGRPAVPVTLRFDAGFPLILTIEVTDGEPPTRVSIHLVDQPGDEGFRLAVKSGVVSGGSFPAGLHDYRIEADGFAPATIRLDVSALQPMPRVALTRSYRFGPR